MSTKEGKAEEDLLGLFVFEKAGQEQVQGDLIFKADLGGNAITADAEVLAVEGDGGFEHGLHEAAAVFE